MIEKEVIWLGKVQADDETAETLGAADYLHVIPSKSAIEVIPTMGEIEEVGPNFENNKQVLLTTNTNIKLAQYLYSLGNSAVPDFVRVLEGCGYSLNTTVVEAGKNIFTLTPGNTSKKLSFEAYQVAAATNAIKRNAHNIILSPKFVFDGSNVPQVEYSGVGCFGSESVVLHAALPAITRRSVSPRGFNGVTASIMTDSYKCSKLEIDPSVTAEQMIDWTKADGFGTSELTGMKVKINATIYLDTTDTLPNAVLRAGTTSAINFEWGVTGNKIQFSFTTGQIIKATPTKIGKYEAYDLEIMALANAHTITANYGLT